MSQKSTSKASHTDWKRIDAMRDADIDFSELPEITEEQMARAVLRIAGKAVPRGTVRVNLDLDPEVLAYFKTKSQAFGKRYQALINETLKSNSRAQNLETTLRRVIREELRAAKQT